MHHVTYGYQAIEFVHLFVTHFYLLELFAAGHKIEKFIQTHVSLESLVVLLHAFVVDVVVAMYVQELNARPSLCER
jgi:hypothetical protein